MRRRVGGAQQMFAEPEVYRVGEVRSISVRAAGGSFSRINRMHLGLPNGTIVEGTYRNQEITFQVPSVVMPGRWRVYVYYWPSNRNVTAVFRVNGKIFGENQRDSTGGTSATRYFLVEPAAAAAPTSRAATSSSPRYEIRSPVINGTYYEGVRELTARELSSYRNRGFTVRPTTAALQAPIRVRAGAQPPRAAGSGKPRRRRGVSTVMKPAADARRGLRRITDGSDIRHKSTRTRVFREYNENPFSQSSSDWIALQKVINGKLQVVLTRGSDAYRWIRGGYTIKFRNPNTPHGMRQTWWWYETLRQTGQVRWGSSPPPTSYKQGVIPAPVDRTGRYATGGSSGGSSRGTSGGGGSSADVSALRRELAQLRSEIAGLHTAATGLGGSTTDRAREISELRERYNAEVADIHAKLTALGSAGTDSSAAVADIHAKIDALAAQVSAARAAGGAAGGGGGGFGLDQIGQLLPLIVIIMLLGVVAKR